MLILLLATNGVALPPPAKAGVQATASIRIERPAIANSSQWERSAKSVRRELVVHDEHGRPVLVRIIEFQ